ncbi:MAG TPA: flagellar basal-body rod protein FlgG [Myxococcota bacterium]|nr:flagellar basal-body rod protein FlgG [Myxococcota bacterium]
MKALYTAATGMNAQQTRLDNIANNLANVNTTAYKKQSAAFEDLFYEEVEATGGDESQMVQVGGGVKLASTNRDFTGGALVKTSSSLDFAIEGEGFFVLETVEGEPRYTRDGSFRTDSDGLLVNSAGLRLSGDISLPDEHNGIVLLEDGTLTALSIDGSGEEILGQLELARFTNPGGLDALGGNLYMQSAASGEPLSLELGSTTTVRQYYLEGSNVDIASELIGMIEAQRAYELTSKVVQAADENLQTAVNLKR